MNEILHQSSCLQYSCLEIAKIQSKGSHKATDIAQSDHKVGSDLTFAESSEHQTQRKHILHMIVRVEANTNDTIDVYEGDNVDEIVSSFALKHCLNQSMRNKLLKNVSICLRSN